MGKDGKFLYDCESDASRYKVGMVGAHLMGPLQCDLCVFRTLYHMNPRQVRSDEYNLKIIRRMNLYDIWSREPSTTKNNLG